MNYMSSFAWVDLAEPVEYFKQTITQETIGQNNYLEGSNAEIKLELIEVDMQNELWNPFPSSVGQFFFLVTAEGGIEEKIKSKQVLTRWERDVYNNDAI